MTKVYVIDTMIHIFRAYHSLPRTLTTPDGLVTNAVYGFLGILRSLWKSQKIDHCVAVLESLSPNFREQDDASYKANRQSTPDDLRAQIPIIVELLHHLGVKTLSVEGFEADDVLGSLAKRAVEHDCAVSIVSNDKDLAQVLAVGDNVELLRLHGGKSEEHVLAADVPSIYGVKAEQIPSLLALMGDTSDNIIGVKGIGQKTAAKILGGGDLEAVLQDPVRAGRFAQVVTTEQEHLRHNLHLATIRLDVPLPFSGWPVDDFRPGSFSADLGAFCHKLQLKSMLSELEGGLFAPNSLEQLWS